VKGPRDALKWLSVVGLLALALLVWGGWYLSAAPAVKQPIQFPHKTHLEFLECTDCHERATKGSVAGRPSTENCLSCHSGGEAESQELKKLQAFGEKGQEIPWKRVWRLPSHVFFPHRTHVVVAKVKCQTCHGPMETLDRPPARALKTLSMNDCIACHEKWERSRENEAGEGKPEAAAKRWISTDCNVCHR
jgi:hypothetical protein